MKKSILSLHPFLMVILVVFAFACGDDDDSNGNNPPTTEEMLVGTWTTSASEITTSVGGQLLTDYLVNDLGWTQEDAELYSAAYDAQLEAAVDGTLTFNADNTYNLVFDQVPENGTWSLSADETTLTLNDGTEEIDVTLNSVTSNTLDVTIEDTLTDDLDDNPETPDEEIEASVDITLTK